jgi:glycosyltransferase involved in cell wall biosynthesis
MMLGLGDIAMIIPCRNEADNIEAVIKNAHSNGVMQIVIGLDPATTDDTAKVCEKLGCTVVKARRSGYDPAVDGATEWVLKHSKAEAFVYADAGSKYSFHYVTEMLEKLNSGADLVLAARTDAGSTMLWHQKFGTQMVLMPIKILMRRKVLDITPFRMVRRSVFKKVSMNPQTFRWPSEMLVKALALEIPISEILVESLPRQGTSTVSGSLKNSAKAGFEMFSSLQFIRYKESR